MGRTIVLEGVRKSINGRTVLDSLDLSVSKNEILSVIGPSGAGKTTLLRIIAGLERPDEGRVRVEGKAGMVFQHSYLWPHKTVLDNVVEALLQEMEKQQAHEKARQMLERLGLADSISAFPDTLSGGEMQRVAIARTLATEPDVLLLDEITSALDPVLVAEVLSMLRKLAKEKRTMLIVTHEMGFAREISDRVVFLHGGRIAEQGHPWKMFSNPENAETRTFINSIIKR
jgi:polar amino acid transport system ATP-binding protein